MTNDIIRVDAKPIALNEGAETLPAIIEAAGSIARFAYEEFFNAEIENDYTQRAYRKAVHRLLAYWEDRDLGLEKVKKAQVS